MIPTKMSITTKQMITSVVDWLPFKPVGGWDVAGPKSKSFFNLDR